MATDRQTFNKGDLARMLGKLAGELKHESRKLDLFIYGGAAFVLRDEGVREHTGDIDAFSPDTSMTTISPLRRKVAEDIAAEDGQPPFLRWLTVSAPKSGTDIGGLVAERDDQGGFKNFDAILPELKDQGLTVYVLKDQAQLAMKLLRETPEGIKPQDKADIAKLLKKLNMPATTLSLRKVWGEYKGKLGQSPDKRAKVERNLTNPAYWGLDK